MSVNRRSFITLLAGVIAAPASLFSESAREKWTHIIQTAAKSEGFMKPNLSWREQVYQLYPDSPAPLMSMLEKLKKPKPGMVEDCMFEWGHSYPLQPKKRTRRLPRRGQRRI